MSKELVFFGIIKEPYANSELAFLREHNNKQILALPEYCEWPPLCRPMFSVSESNGKGALIDYRTRVIHFAASIKAVEDPWEEWKTKFEEFLGNLYWTRAEVYWKMWWAKEKAARWEIAGGPLELEIMEIKRSLLKENWTYKEY